MSGIPTKTPAALAVGYVDSGVQNYTRKSERRWGGLEEPWRDRDQTPHPPPGKIEA